MSFDPNTEERPNMDVFYNHLRCQLLTMRGGDDSQLTDSFINRRRSTRSLRSVEEGPLSCEDSAPRARRVRKSVKNHLKMSFSRTKTM